MSNKRRYILFLVLVIALVGLFNTGPAQAQTTDLLITGAIDGPLSGGTPKAVEFYVLNNIPDLSVYGFGGANNGGGSDGEEFTFPADSATAGDFIYVATESVQFTAWFGFAPNYTNGTAPSINGDDAIELFESGVVVDVFGDINVDGTGQPWEYLDGWAYRVDGTGPDGSTFILANWTFSGPNALDGETSNGTAATPFPVGSYVPGGGGDTAPVVSGTTPSNGATNVALASNIDINFNEDVAVAGSWFDITCNASGSHTAVVSGGPQNYTLDPDSDFVNSENCVVTVFAAQATDVDTEDPPDNMDADYVFSFTTEGTAITTVVINEFQADPASDLSGDANGDGVRDSGDDEFIEIVNVSGGDLDISGWTLSDGFGLRHTFPVGTVIADSCSVVVFGGGTPAGAFGGSVVQTASEGALGLNNSGDTITLNNGASDLIYDYGSEGGNNQSLTRDPDITGPDPLALHSTATGSGGALFSPGTMIDGALFSGCEAPPPPISKIHNIQGNGPSSPLVGATVMIEGVVVGDFQDVGEFGGFHVQEEDADADGDPETSEGIFVYHYSTAVAVGDVVQVTGTVAEYYGLTRLSNISNVAVVSSGASVSPALVSLPVASVNDLEAYEGMSVKFEQALTISEYFNFDRYGEIVLTVDRPFQPTAIYAPNSPQAIALADENVRSRIMLDDGRGGSNPDPARHPNGATFDLTNRFRGGDQVQNVVGVMDYAFGNYKVQPTDGADYIPLNPRANPHDAVGGNLKVASFNVLNYFTTLGSRGAGDAEEFDRQRTKIFAALADIDADIVGLIEIENNGPVAISDLVDGLNALVGAGTYAYIDTGVVGDDEIAVAFIYKSAIVTAVGDYAVLDDITFVDPLSTGIDRNRPALAQTFEHNDTGGLATIAVNHFKSKSGSELDNSGAICVDSDPGNDIPDCDQGDGQGYFNATRAAAAQALVDWLTTDPTDSGDADILIIGDLNAYDKEDPISAIETAGYTDLVRQFQGEYAYSYVFSGQFGYLDHALANPEMLAQITGTTVWHINSDEPDILDYDTTYKQDAQDDLYEPNAYRSSDHDPVIIGLNLVNTDVVYVSSNSRGNVGSVEYKDEDIMTYDFATGDWALYFDGSDVGLKATDIDALHLMDDGAILMSFEQPIKIPGFGKVDDSDIVKFVPTELGEDTAGSFEWFFDGSDVDLRKGGEDVDAIGFTPDGRLVVSVLATAKVPMTGGGILQAGDEQLIVLNNAVFGADTVGDWEMYFDGRDVNLRPEDIWSVWLDSTTDDIYISLQNEFMVGGVSGDELDIIVCHPDSLGEETACTFEMYFDGSEEGFGGNKIDAIAIEQ
ncbi:MAG: ExeM/NucH family extracellular endonuclease [Chloroflexi bacterium]|nr:ExeM/NucH family extracellular endonuclease [Chloroflexota bacterium]